MARRRRCDGPEGSISVSCASEISKFPGRTGPTGKACPGSAEPPTSDIRAIIVEDRGAQTRVRMQIHHEGSVIPKTRVAPWPSPVGRPTGVGARAHYAPVRTFRSLVHEVGVEYRLDQDKQRLLVHAIQDEVQEDGCSDAAAAGPVLPSQTQQRPPLASGLPDGLPPLDGLAP